MFFTPCHYPPRRPLHLQLLPQPSPTPTVAAFSHDLPAQSRARSWGIMVAPPGLFQGSSFSLVVDEKPRCSLDSRTCRNSVAPRFSILCSAHPEFLSSSLYQEMTIATHSQATSHGLDALSPPNSTEVSHLLLRHSREYAKHGKHCQFTIVPFCMETANTWAPSDPE